MPIVPLFMPMTIRTVHVITSLIVYSFCIVSLSKKIVKNVKKKSRYRLFFTHAFFTSTLSFGGFLIKSANCSIGIGFEYR